MYLRGGSNVLLSHWLVLFCPIGQISFRSTLSCVFCVFRHVLAALRWPRREMKSSQSSSQALFAVLRNSLPGLSERRQRGSDNWEATTRKRQLGSDNSEATTWKQQLGSDNSEGTIRKRQLGSDNSEATTRKRQLKKIYTKYIPGG